VRRIGADVGGTFTDVVLADADGRIRVEKVLSTPPVYDRAVVDAVLALGGADEVVHGTTVATNAVLELRGALTAVVTTEGFRDVLELRRMRMPHLYDTFWAKPPPNRKTDHRVLKMLLVIVTNLQLPNKAQASSCARTMQLFTVRCCVLMK